MPIESNGDSPDGSTAQHLQAAAEDAFGWPELGPVQLEAMQRLLQGNDLLAVMPTGSGKSAIYQVPALLLGGPTVVVSPLIALQREQVQGIGRSQAPDAVAVNSAQRRRQSTEAWESMRAGTSEFLFLSPEQLAKTDVVEALKETRPSLFVVDEAHCVSMWGHDFRPDYLRLGEVIEQLGHPPLAALTATAAPPVRSDIIEHLRMRSEHVVVSGLDRPNLDLRVHRFVTEQNKRQAVVERVNAERKPGLVYVATRKETETYAAPLEEKGLHAAAYHGGMKNADRMRVHQEFAQDEVDVVAATTAFGMGVDKPNVGFVVHAFIPGSLDSYYQEIGRAGRDGKPATAVLYYRPEDLRLRKFFAAAGVDSDAVRSLVERLREYGRPTTRKALGAALGLSRTKLTRLVNLLEQAGVIAVTSRGRLSFSGEVTPEEAAERVRAVAQTRERIEQSRVEMMRAYAETSACRRQFLLAYFGEPLEYPCGNCGTCEAGSAYEQPPLGDGERRYGTGSGVDHAEWGHGVVVWQERERLTVLFDGFGYRTLTLPVAEANDLLVPE